MMKVTGVRVMDESKKRKLEKLFLPNEGEDLTQDQKDGEDIVEVGNHPYDRLRRGLRRAFPGMPDLIFSKDKKKES
jgi:hypothetical protein